MLERRGPATLVELGSSRLLVDAGSGVVHRLLEAGQPTRLAPGAGPALTHILLTHLHSDHIMGLPDLLWTGWIMDWWSEPPTILGPPGTAELIRRLVHTFEFDIRVRNSVDRLPRPWVTPTVKEFTDNGACEAGEFLATPFRVDHNPVDQAFGIRLDCDDGAVAFSGDTRPLESLAKACEGVDLLLHEVYDSELARTQLQTASERFGVESPQFKARAGIVAYHTLAKDLGPIAALADTPHLVLNHVIGPTDTSGIEQDIRQHYRGNITVGADLQRFDLSH